MKRNVILSIVAIGASCEPDVAPESESVLAEGEHVIVFSDEERELCGATVGHMDDFIRRVAMEFGVEPPRGDERIKYHWLTADSIEKACGGPVLGCAPGGEIWSQRVPLDHELVHAVAARFGLPRSLFAEGLAVAYEDIGRQPLPAYDIGGPKDVLALVELDQVEFARQGGYRLAGSFTSFLIDRYGIDEYLDAYSSIGRFADKDEVDRVFSDVFGASLAESVAEFEALPWYLGDECNQPAFGAKLTECAASEISWNGESLSFERSLACEQDTSIGPYDDKIVSMYTIKVGTQGVYELRMLGDEQDAQTLPDFTLVNQAVTGVSLFRCGDCETYEWMSTWHGSTPRLAEIRPGLYTLRLHGPADQSVSVGFTLTRVADTLDPGP